MCTMVHLSTIQPKGKLRSCVNKNTATLTIASITAVSSHQRPFFIIRSSAPTVFLLFCVSDLFRNNSTNNAAATTDITPTTLMSAFTMDHLADSVGTNGLSVARGAVVVVGVVVEREAVVGGEAVGVGGEAVVGGKLLELGLFVSIALCVWRC